MDTAHEQGPTELDIGEVSRCLVSGMDHELRTALTTLLGHVELLLDQESELPAAVCRSLGALHRSGLRLRHVAEWVTELVDIGIAARASDREVDLDQMVRDLAAGLEPRARTRGISLKVRAPWRVTIRLVDPDRVVRAVEELLENALTHTADHTTVTIRVTGDELGACIRVADQGAGIAPEDRTRLVMPFERGDHPGQRPEGAGLGLARVMAIAEAHGGSVTLDENQVRGLEVGLRLPYALGQASAEEGDQLSA